MAAPDIALDAWWGGPVKPSYFELHSGDDRTLTVTLRDRTQTVVALTGTYVFVITSGDTPDSGTEISKSGSVTAGVATVTIDDTDTDSLFGRFYFEMTVTETSSAAESVVMWGSVDIFEDV